jgi:hypothetical protein
MATHAAGVERCDGDAVVAALERPPGADRDDVLVGVAVGVQEAAYVTDGYLGRE